MAKITFEDQPVLNDKEIEFLEEHDIVTLMENYAEWDDVDFNKVVTAYVIGYKKENNNEQR